MVPRSLLARTRRCGCAPAFVLGARFCSASASTLTPSSRFSDSVLGKILGRAAGRQRRIVFPEGNDQRVIDAAVRVKQEGIAEVTVISPGENSMLRKAGVCVEALGSSGSFDADALERAHELVGKGDADGVVSGAVHTSGNVIRKSIQHFRKKGVSLSSFFLMVDEKDANEKMYMFADCSVLVEPTSEQLVDITVESIKSYRLLFGRDPKVAMLSFSTKGSADAPSVRRVRAALEAIRAEHPDVAHLVDGEFQADVATCIDVAKHKKCDNGNVAGNADVLIFPSLDSGNIAYKLTERLGGYTAIGPVLQGLDKPCSDLSRGCSVEDIICAAAIASLQSQ